jgi:hypothetical protein
VDDPPNESFSRFHLLLVNDRAVQLAVKSITNTTAQDGEGIMHLGMNGRLPLNDSGRVSYEISFSKVETGITSSEP